MITSEVISYIKSEQAKNTSDETIKSNLLSSGWNEKDIEDALYAVTMNTSMHSIPIETDIQLKKYRSRVIRIIFYVLSLIYTYLFFLQLPSGLIVSTDVGIQLLFFILGLPVILLSSYITSSGTKPFSQKWREVVDIMVRIIGAGIFTVMIAFALFFATCLFIATTSGF